MRFVVIGDATLDVTVRPDAPPMPGRDRPARIEVGPGGQGANVAVRLARRGAAVRLIAGTAADDAGALVRAALAAEGVELVNLDVPRTGVVVSLVDHSGERAMLSDRASFGAESLRAPSVAGALADADWVHVSGYPLVDPVNGAILAEVMAARPPAAHLSVSGGSFAPRSAIGERLDRSRPDLLVFDRGEGLVALEVAGRPAPIPADELAQALQVRYRAVTVITDGANPVVAASTDDVLARAMPGRLPVVDTTGAGDALTAEIIGGLAGGPWPPHKSRLQRALEAGVRRGAEVASLVGAQTRVASEGPA